VPARRLPQISQINQDDPESVLCADASRHESSAFVLVGWCYSRNVPRIAGRSRVNAANHAIVTVREGVPISEFLIIGCQHGSLMRIG
jgi:hypothetical protein